MSAQRTAVITGAGSERGIGIDVAPATPARAGRWWCSTSTPRQSAKVAADIGNQYDVPAFGYAVDVTSEESVAAARRRSPRKWPRATCRPSARWPTSPASPRRCRSWTPRWSCGTR